MDINNLNTQTLTKNMQDKQDRFIEAKKKFSDKIDFTIQDITEHIQFKHQEACECTNILSFFITNLQCMQEDLEDWSYNDRESWLRLLSPDGVCESALIFVHNIESLLIETEEWDTEFTEFVDPMITSLKRVERDTNQAEQENNEKLNAAESKLEILQKKLAELEQQEKDRVPYDKESQKQFQQQNFFETQQQQQQNPFQDQKLANLNTANQNIEKEELEGFLQESIEIKKEIQNFIDTIQEHQKEKNSQNCDCKSWFNQLLQFIQDIPFWSKLDQQSWESTLKIFKFIKCKIAPQQLQELKNLLVITNEWFVNFPNVTNQDRQISQKFQQDTEQLLENQNNPQNIKDIITNQNNQLQMDLKNLSGQGLVDIQKMQQELYGAMQNFENLSLEQINYEKQQLELQKIQLDLQKDLQQK